MNAPAVATKVRAFAATSCPFGKLVLIGGAHTNSEANLAALSDRALRQLFSLL